MCGGPDRPSCPGEREREREREGEGEREGGREGGREGEKGARKRQCVELVPSGRKEERERETERIKSFAAFPSSEGVCSATAFWGFSLGLRVDACLSGGGLTPTVEAVWLQWPIPGPPAGIELNGESAVLCVFAALGEYRDVKALRDPHPTSSAKQRPRPRDGGEAGAEKWLPQGPKWHGGYEHSDPECVFHGSDVSTCGDAWASLRRHGHVFVRQSKRKRNEQQVRSKPGHSRGSRSSAPRSGKWKHLRGCQRPPLHSRQHDPPEELPRAPLPTAHGARPQQHTFRWGCSRCQTAHKGTVGAPNSAGGDNQARKKKQRTQAVTAAPQLPAAPTRRAPPPLFRRCWI